MAGRLISRGEVMLADLPELGRKPVLVISAPPVNWALNEVIVARITSSERERALDTVVPLAAAETGLDRDSYAVCHDLATVSKRRLRETVAMLPDYAMPRIEQALRAALAL